MSGKVIESTGEALLSAGTLGRGAGSARSYKARAEIGGRAEGVGARRIPVDPSDSTTGGEGRLGTSVVLDAEPRMRAWQTPTTP